MLNVEQDKLCSLAQLTRKIGEISCSRNDCKHCKCEFKYKKNLGIKSKCSYKIIRAAETTSSAQIQENVAQGRAFVLDFSN